ncbi:biliverdin-producing heme oxygenase [Mucilaginibacter pedocola]|uniref:biliverdin-producing heme oxygenase n=1 Tax=Mucilaginibacter pedocola TaxID=1792845 RepID=UPI001EE3C3EF|nr:biliverdin-producing heme oxygenase [Mucilaginibacter pedocola]
MVLQLKSIRSNADYANVLKNFYAYFSALETAIKPYITTEVLPDYSERRNSSYLKADIEELGADVNDLPPVTVPTITNAVEAMGALYVMEGSIMGGPYIVQMLQKHGMDKGFSFFSGYGADTGRIWGAFVAQLNAIAPTNADEAAAINTANETFANFGELFESKMV